VNVVFFVVDDYSIILSVIEGEKRGENIEKKSRKSLEIEEF
jgi:hypothetical protein